MSSPPAGRSSSPGEDSQLADRRKRKRMLSNRESARRSRARKQQHMEGLVGLAARLGAENAELEVQIAVKTRKYAGVEEENTALRAQVAALADWLQSLNSVLCVYEEISGMPMDIPEMPAPLLEPWHLPRPAMPVPAASAAADMLQF